MTARQYRPVGTLSDALAVWNIEQLRQHLGIGRQTEYRMIAAGELPPRVQLSPRRFGWRKADIEAWIDARSSSPPQPSPPPAGTFAADMVATTSATVRLAIEVGVPIPIRGRPENVEVRNAMAALAKTAVGNSILFPQPPSMASAEFSRWIRSLAMAALGHGNYTARLESSGGMRVWLMRIPSSPAHPTLTALLPGAGQRRGTLDLD